MRATFVLGGFQHLIKLTLTLFPKDAGAGVGAFKQQEEAPNPPLYVSGLKVGSTSHELGA